MRLLFGFAILCVLSFEVFATNEKEIKKGTFPYMGFVYYQDKTIKDDRGNRFRQAAVLIRADWLLSSALDPFKDGITVGFPHKTMMARFGALTVDDQFTMKDDEFEQEHEVIKIVRPNQHKANSWWHTAVTLLKTESPFEMTGAVDTASIGDIAHEDTSCIMALYMEMDNKTLLSKISVNISRWEEEGCGDMYKGASVFCGEDAEPDSSRSPEFCYGNNGGPVICSGEVKGLQTYAQDCKSPYVFQMLLSWKKFIHCGVEDICDSESCNNCEVTNKDHHLDHISNKNSATSVSEENLRSGGDDSKANSTDAPAVITSEVSTDSSISTTESTSKTTNKKNITRTTTKTKKLTDITNITSTMDNNKKSNEDTTTKKWPYNVKEGQAEDDNKTLSAVVEAQSQEDPIDPLGYDDDDDDATNNKSAFLTTVIVSVSVLIYSL